MSEQNTIRVEVAYALAGKQALLELQVAEGTTALEAARQSGIVDKFDGIDLDNAKLGIFARAVSKSGARRTSQLLLRGPGLLQQV
jgi:putative ubiquitin-RnfH superfamily antitoxin RatB of RatAB toxin-antitoxin module